MQRTFLQCVWAYDSRDFELVCRRSHTVCSQRVCPLNVSACVPCGCYRSSYTLCNPTMFLQNVLACVFGGNQLVWTNSCAVCKQKVFLNGSACVSWGYQLLRRSSRTLCKQKDSLHCEPACVFSDEQLWCLRGFFYWMCEHVPLEVTGCCARVFTLWTTERLSPWMGQHVSF